MLGEDALGRALRKQPRLGRCILAIEDPYFFFQAEDGIRDLYVTGVQTCALPILGIGAVDTHEALSLRMLGMHGAAFANYAVEDCDFLVALGADRKSVV